MQYVTFIAGGETFAVEMAPVQEIIRVPDVVRVPLAPASLNGLANLRGKVLPIVDLRQVCGFDSTTTDDTSRALVLDYGEPLGFVVDRVVSVIAVDSTQLEDVGTITSAVNTELLSGLITNAGDQGMVMVLDFRKVIEREFASLAASTSRSTRDVSNGSYNEVDTPLDEAATDEMQLVSFHVAGQEYAVAIEHVQEIVPVPDTFVRVPHTASHVVGVMTLRERVLPLVSLRGMFGLPPQRDTSRERVVVMTMNGAHVGVVTDSVSEVLRVSRQAVEPMPRLLAQDGGVVDVTQLCRLGNGQRLVSVVDVQALFRHDSMQEAIAMRNSHTATESDGSGNSIGSEEQFVVLRLGRDEFGVPISAVQEIVRLPDELTRVPRAPEFVEGVINLRGSVLPVIDLRRRLGLPAIERTDGQRVMVFTFDGTRTGFIVDAVAEVLSIPTRAISEAPRLSAEQGTTLSRMANLEQQQRIVQLIAPQHLLGALEREALNADITEFAT